MDEMFTRRENSVLVEKLTLVRRILEAPSCANIVADTILSG